MPREINLRFSVNNERSRETVLDNWHLVVGDKSQRGREDHLALQQWQMDVNNNGGAWELHRDCFRGWRRDRCRAG